MSGCIAITPEALTKANVLLLHNILSTVRVIIYHLVYTAGFIFLDIGDYVLPEFFSLQNAFSQLVSQLLQIGRLATGPSSMAMCTAYHWDVAEQKTQSARGKTQSVRGKTHVSAFHSQQK